MNDNAPLSFSADPWTVIAFIFYLGLMVGIGVYAAKFSSAGLGEFFIGGRKMRSFVVALSAVVSGRSAWLVVGVTGMAYARGVSAVWAIAGYTIAELLMFVYAARRLRLLTERMDSLTIPDFFASRFKDTGQLLRTTAAIVIVIFMLVYIAAQFDAGGKAFASSFGFSHLTGVLLTATIVLFYTLIGGFLAVSLTDVVQAVFMIFALVVVPISAISDFGGMNQILTEISTTDILLVDPLSLGVGGIVGYLGIGLGSPGNPHILVRYMSIRDPSRLRVSALIGTIWNVLMGWGAVMIGLAGRAFIPDPGLLPGGDTENLFVALAQSHLHPVVFGFVLAAIIAAIMSTADSQLLVGASSCVRDLYEKGIARGKALSARAAVGASRWVIVVLVCLALLLREVASELVFWLVLFAWSGLGASFGPPLLAGLYWPRATKWGVFAGVVSGSLITIVWKQIPALSGAIYELVPAFLASSIAVIFVSLVTSPPPTAAEELDSLTHRSPKVR